MSKQVVPQPAQLQAVPSVLITCMPNGEVRAQTNIQDQIYLFGLIERGKDAFRDAFAKQANGQQILAAPAAALHQLAGN